MSTIKNRIKDLRRLFSAIAWCLSLSWKASRLYTVARLLCEAVAPAFAIATNVFLL